MASTFMGLAIAGSGLTASKTGLAVTTNNISNVNTPGYSRQVMNQVAVGPAAVYSNNYIGNGTEVLSVDRVRSFRLDQKYWAENSALGEWQATSSYLTELENVLASSDDQSFSSVMNDFYASMEAVSNDASDMAARTEMVETANSVCSYLNSSAETLTSYRNDLNSEVKTSVDQINSYSTQIADLNQRISLAAAAGADTNELEDQRDNLLDELSCLGEIQVTETTIGKNYAGEDITTYNVNFNGSTLVNGNKARELECYTITDPGTQQGMYGIRWTDSGKELSVGDSGALKGYLDLRDGTGVNGDAKGVPYYQNQLDEFARTFAEAFNEGVYQDGNQYYGGHAGGYGLDGSTGTRFFTYTDPSTGEAVSSDTLVPTGTTDYDAVYSQVTAANISVSADVLADPAKITAASVPGEESNNENMTDLIKICHDSRMFGHGTPEDYYNSIIATLGTSSAYAQRQSDLKEAMVNYIDTNRMAVSGVSTNEETANFTKYQEAYEASAKIVQVWNELYETTINMVNDG